jgi:hypothetical protein
MAMTAIAIQIPSVTGPLFQHGRKQLVAPAYRHTLAGEISPGPLDPIVSVVAGIIARMFDSEGDSRGGLGGQSDAGLIDEMGAAWRAESMAIARRLAAVGELYARRAVQWVERDMWGG